MIPDSLAQAFALTEAIQTATAENNWVCAAALVEARSPLLMSLQPAQTPEALEIIRAIQRIDGMIALHAQEEKEAMMARQNSAMQKIESVSLYQTTGML
ncbi:flagellar protein FliT [Paraburkholderia hayleyella]|uniref:flagellar protein FliT n=1 Tax=Paraburkholderia hayleyella TaxID=2152889 RepID=UPI001FE2C8DD|nr:flagellar protein FliT [Paraburkholderia hayleyella]